MIGSGCILRITFEIGPKSRLLIHRSNPYPKWDPMVWVISLSPLISSYQLTDKKIDFFQLPKLKNPGMIPSSLNHGDLKNIYMSGFRNKIRVATVKKLSAILGFFFWGGGGGCLGVVGGVWGILNPTVIWGARQKKKWPYYFLSGVPKYGWT